MQVLRKPTQESLYIQSTDNKRERFDYINQGRFIVKENHLIENSKEINKLLSKIIPEFKKDTISILKKISTSILKHSYNLMDKHRIKELINKLSSLINSDNELVLNEDTLLILVKILSVNFIKIDKEFKINYFDDFLERFNKEDKIDNFNHKNMSYMGSIISGDHLSQLEPIDLKKSIISTMTITKYNNNITGPFPEDLRMTSSILDNVKILKLIIPNNSNLSHDYFTLILLNINWLFKNLKEIKVDFNIPVQQLSTPSNKNSK